MTRHAPFAPALLAWFDQHGRKDLPWQHPRTAYRVWLSEVMLQQTQVATVIPYFLRFVERFPTVSALANAPQQDVLAHWAGLGYYARARNLHAAAKVVVAAYGGEFPQNVAALMQLPGVGRSTAGAIAAQAFGVEAPILDANVRRVLSRWDAVDGSPASPATLNRLWQLAEQLLPSARLPDYTQALMDLGATLCKARAPQCLLCPVAHSCKARQQGRVTDYPAAKPKRERPSRAAWLLLCQDLQGRLLLGQRPSPGIWGGLWAPPQCDYDGDWRAYLLGLGIEARTLEPLSPISHGFTHFTLTLHPLLLRNLPSSATARLSNDWQWADRAARAALGMPAPIAKLIATLPRLG